MYSQSKSCVESFHKKRTKKEPEPPLEQPCHRLLPSKLYILENGPKWLPVTTFGILESGFAKTEGKDGLLIMPLFYHVFFLPLPLSFFLSFFLFSSSFSLNLYYCLAVGSSFLSMATIPLYIELIPWDFSLLPLGLHQLFLVCCGHPFRATHQPISCLATTATG